MTDGIFFLGGGGDNEISKDVDILFFSKLNSSSKILYCPVAWEKSYNNYSECFEWFSNLVRKYVKTDKINITILTEESVSEIDFNNFDAIYIGGGNTFKLLDFFYKNDLFEKIKVFIRKENKIIFGGSAGAMIFGKDINTVIEEKKNYSLNLGFNILNNFSIRCHYNNLKDRNFLKNIVNKINGNIYAIPEESALILDKNFRIVKIVGDVFEFKKNEDFNIEVSKLKL